MSDDKKMIEDIKKGKPLPPIVSGTDKTKPKSGRTTEKEEQEDQGLRIELYSLR